MGRGALTLVLCAWTVVSQHAGTDGAMWWRTEATAVSAEQCRLLLKAVVVRPKVGLGKWYDVSPLTLEKHFTVPATPDKGTWVGCYPAEFPFGEADS